MPDLIPTIAADKLAQLTGFTVVELSRLAVKGYFPRAKSGVYEQSKAIPGCFKAYQDRLQEGVGAPVFQSMAECATQTGIPRTVLKEARKQSPESFRAHRILLFPLIRWIFGKGNDGEDWGDRLKKAQALREEIRLAKDKEVALDKGQVTTAVARAVAVFFSTLDRYSDELPAILHGMNATGIKEKLTANNEALKTQLRSTLTALVPQDEKRG